MAEQLSADFSRLSANSDLNQPPTAPTPFSSAASALNQGIQPAHSGGAYGQPIQQTPPYGSATQYPSSGNNSVPPYQYNAGQATAPAATADNRGAPTWVSGIPVYQQENAGASQVPPVPNPYTQPPIQSPYPQVLQQNYVAQQGYAQPTGPPRPATQPYGASVYATQPYSVTPSSTLPIQQSSLPPMAPAPNVNYSYGTAPYSSAAYVPASQAPTGQSYPPFAAAAPPENKVELSQVVFRGLFYFFLLAGEAPYRHGI